MSQQQHNLPFRERSQHIDSLLQHIGEAHNRFLLKTSTLAESLEEDKKRAEERRAKAFKEVEEVKGNLGCVVQTGAGIGFFIGVVIDISAGIFVFSWLGAIVGAVGGILSNQGNQSGAEERANTEYYSSIRRAEDRSETESKSETDRLQNQIHYNREEITKLIEAGKPSGSSWSDNAWKEWKPLNIPTGLSRLGQLRPGEGRQGNVPLLLPFPGDRGLLYLARGNNRDLAIRSLQSTLLCMLAAVPAGKLRFTFIDPLGLGQNAASFMRLGDYDAELITNRAWSESRHIDQRLAELTEHTETVIQKYLRTEFKTIDEYNVQAGEVAEPYRLLVVFDFPVNFNEENARRLLSIVQNGPRCGVYTMMTVDHQRLGDWQDRYGQDFSFDELERQFAVADFTGNPTFSYKSLRDCPLDIDKPPEPALINRIIDTIGVVAKDTNTVEVPFARIVSPAAEYWKADSRDSMSVPIGPSGARRLQEFTLGLGTAQHALIAGRTGSGKSTLLHALITNLALKYSPDEIQLYLVDFKKGVEFKAYATHKLPHARVIAIESEREFGLSVLQGLDAELGKRGERFRSAQVDSLGSYRDKSGEKLPRILLLVDEFQEFFTEDDPIAQGSSRILDRLVRQGRAFGIHVLLGSQSLAGAYSLARSTVDQMAVRIALQCSEADSRLILAEDNAAARLLSRPGEAIYNNANGMIEGNQPFQVAYLPDDERNEWLVEIRKLYDAKSTGEHLPDPIVFEGNSPALVEKNQQLQNLLTIPQPPQSSRAVSVWFGEPIAIADPTSAIFRRQSGANLLIVGQNSESSASMLAVSLIALSAQYSAARVQFFILDYSTVDMPETELLEQVAQIISGSQAVFHGRRRKTEEFINTVATELQKREQMEDTELVEQPVIYLLVYGLQRARDLRQDENSAYSSFNYNLDSDEVPPPDPTQQFQTILRDGPELGVHTLVWCDTVTNLNRILDRRVQREFEMRIAFQMGAEDSANLVDTPIASKLGPFRAIYVNDEEGIQQKFRPYGLPNSEWLNWVREQLQERVRM